MRGFWGMTIAGSLLAGAALVSGCATGAKATGEPSRTAWAELRNASGASVGSALLRQDDGRVRIVVQASGLTPGRHGIHVLGSFIFGLPSDTKDSFDATVALAERADLTFAQFVLLTPFPGTVDFEKWEQDASSSPTAAARLPGAAWMSPRRKPSISVCWYSILPG